MSDKEIFLKAARLIFSRDESCCCSAIDEAMVSRDYCEISSLQQRFWEQCFQPLSSSPTTWWLAVMDDFLFANTIPLYRSALKTELAIYQERVLALCFAAAMAETGDI